VVRPYRIIKPVLADEGGNVAVPFVDLKSQYLSIKEEIDDTVRSVVMSSSSQSTVEILMITTATEYRGRGFGVKLLSMLDDDLGKRGIQVCLARVREDNAHAMAMYKTIGYHEIGSVTFNGSQ